MAKQPHLKAEVPTASRVGIDKVTVSGFKSLLHPQTIEVAPLTILAGANSSGKSSIMQPLLLLKQTLESSYDPGPLLLDGPNVWFSSVDQLLSRESVSKQVTSFRLEIVAGTTVFTSTFHGRKGKGFEIQEQTIKTADGVIVLRPGMKEEEIEKAVTAYESEISRVLLNFQRHQNVKPRWTVARDRCFLNVRFSAGAEGSNGGGAMELGSMMAASLREIIHVPAMRGNPERFYPVTAVGPMFPGTFEDYTASVIARWQTDDDKRIQRLSRDLLDLGLTWKVRTEPISDTELELQVGRLPRAATGGARDLVDIADVGFGISQVLPVIVALRVAKPGQLVYIEEPEIHLHPRAQHALARILADAAKSGIRIVAETHSAILLLAIQTLVAKGELSSATVRLHWFSRKSDGASHIQSAGLDETGAYGDWPADFDTVALETERTYLDEVESKEAKR